MRYFKYWSRFGSDNFPIKTLLNMNKTVIKELPSVQTNFRAVIWILSKITYCEKQYSEMIKRPILLLPCSCGRRITWGWCVLWWRVIITGPISSLRSVVVICQNNSEWSGTSWGSVTWSWRWGCGTMPDLASIWRTIQKIDFLKQFERKLVRATLFWI